MRIALRDPKHPENRLFESRRQVRQCVNCSHGTAMELFSVEFLSALAAIVVIDLVLAGDNAIVIALAARSLPRDLQKRAIVWGTAGAIVVRSAMTMVVVWLLKVPGLMLVGGALLIWIAYRLLAPTESDESEHGPAATSFWGAMRTIVIADAVMGLDNVLAVAGAAHGSYLLVVLGLLISIPIVIWGSTLILHWVERYPVIVYVGAGVLAWTAAKMMLGEPLLKDALAAANGTTAPLTYLVVIGGVLWAGFVRNHRRLDSRISARLAALRAALAEAPAEIQSNEGEPAMQRILLPVDGSRNAEFAVRHVIAEFLKDSAMEVHLLNVQPPFSRHIAQFASARNRESWHREQAEKALAPARALLEQHGVPHTATYKLGARAQVIVDEARRLRCQRIMMSTARKNSLTRMLQDSTTNSVLERTSVPVELVAGDAISPFERWGLPAGAGALIAMLIAGID
jgi:YjbE family integral membrane protein